MFAASCHLIVVCSRPHHKICNSLAFLKLSNDKRGLVEATTRIVASLTMYKLRRIYECTFRSYVHVDKELLKPYVQFYMHSTAETQYAWLRDFDELRHAQVTRPSVKSAWSHFKKKNYERKMCTKVPPHAEKMSRAKMQKGAVHILITKKYHVLVPHYPK